MSKIKKKAVRLQLTPTVVFLHREYRIKKHGGALGTPRKLLASWQIMNYDTTFKRCAY